MLYTLAFVLFLIGLYATITKRNLIKIIIGVIIMEQAVNLFLLLVGYRMGGLAPIMDETMTLEEFVSRAVDPLPQALVITSIVISLGSIALMVAIAIRIYEKYGTYDIAEIRRLRG
jgi:multicomponent Na+:H+ antiporter subunit C